MTRARNFAAALARRAVSRQSTRQQTGLRADLAKRDNTSPTRESKPVNFARPDASNRIKGKPSACRALQGKPKTLRGDQSVRPARSVDSRTRLPSYSAPSASKESTKTLAEAPRACRAFRARQTAILVNTCVAIVLVGGTCQRRWLRRASLALLGKLRRTTEAPHACFVHQENIKTPRRKSCVRSASLVFIATMTRRPRSLARRVRRATTKARQAKQPAFLACPESIKMRTAARPARSARPTTLPTRPR